MAGSVLGPECSVVAESKLPYRNYNDPNTTNLAAAGTPDLRCPPVPA